MNKVEQQLKLVKKLKQELWVNLDTVPKDSFVSSDLRICFSLSEKGKKIVEQIIKLKDDELHKYTRTN